MEDRFKKTEYKLYNYKDLNKLTEIIDIKIKKILNDVSLGGGDMFGEKSSPTNKFNSMVENDVISRENKDIDKQINKLRQEKESILIEKQLIESSLDLLTKEERRLVELRYFSRPKKSWDNIALETSQSKNNCLNVRKKVIKKLTEYLL